ncbi:hypothetical protein ACVBAX_17285 [Robertmurraya sp. GLU-23]
MTLKNQNPLILSNQGEPNSNQTVFRYSYFEDVLQNQKITNSTLSQSIESFHSTLSETTSSHQIKFNELLQEISRSEQSLRDIASIMIEQSKTNQKILERLDKLEKENELVLNEITKEGLMHEAMVDQLSLQDQRLLEISSTLSAHEQQTVELTKQLHVHENMYEEISEKMGLQEVFHQTVMERLDHQEAMSEKIQRQLDHLKTAIYERASHLAETIETNISKVTKPVHRFFVQKVKSEQK